MCLLVDEEKTQKMKEDVKGYITVWKILKSKSPFPNDGPDQIVSPMQFGHNWRPGRTVCNRPTAKYPYKWKGYGSRKCPSDALNGVYPSSVELQSGIHVCLTRQKAREYIREMKEKHYAHANLKIFRCQAYIGSLIAVGTCKYYSTHDKMAVFHCVTIGPEDWAKALNGDFR